MALVSFSGNLPTGAPQFIGSKINTGAAKAAIAKILILLMKE
jgi:hypothetical protein